MDYGYYGESHYDKEEHEPYTPSPYSRVVAAIYQKGAFAANYDIRPPNPYKRADYARFWELGYDDESEKLEAEAGAPMYPWEAA